ncbi:hypothetical protein PoB_000102700 [Plakobranchus ocellatus]|uniref:Uncharacterized protein n=1 Tax=Plakobranchus ocellatus TaxID=259542 RepID=A0AAV3XVN9_9GAST|nr:hypothetical protein PoB_000102700 [Plakobranchus ocellatus]
MRVESTAGSQGNVTILVSFGCRWLKVDGFCLLKTEKPELEVIKKFISTSCSEGFIAVGDTATLEVQTSGNNTEYTYGTFGWPSFREWDLVTKNGKTDRTGDRALCEPFHSLEKGFCVKKEIADETYCSCEKISEGVYRLKLVYKVKDNSRTAIELQWPSQTGIVDNFLTEFYDLPEVLATQPITCPGQDGTNSEGSSGGWCVWGKISLIAILVALLLSFPAHYYGFVKISFYDCFMKRKKSVVSEGQPSRGSVEQTPEGQVINRCAYFLTASHYVKPYSFHSYGTPFMSFFKI